MEEIGYVTKHAHWQAVCTFPRCKWVMTGIEERPEAEQRLQTHAMLCHPKRILVYRHD